MDFGMNTSIHAMPSPPGQSAISVLLVEDSAILAERLGEMMSNIAGVNIAATVDGEAAALAILADQEVDVIVLDLHLRQGTGFGVLRGLPNDSKRPVVIVLTNYDLAEYRRAATVLGAQYFLDKTREIDQLPTVLEELRRRQLD